MVHLRSQASRKKRPRSKTSDGGSESSSTDSELRSVVDSSRKPVVDKPLTRSRAQPKFPRPREGLDQKADKHKERTGIKAPARSNVNTSEALADDDSRDGNGADVTLLGKWSNGLETSHRDDRDRSRSVRSVRSVPKVVAFDPSGGAETSQRGSQSLKYGDDTDRWKYHHHDAPPPHQMYDRQYDINQGQNRYSGYYPHTVWYATGPNRPNYAPPLGPPFPQLIPQNGFHAYFNQGNQNQQSAPYWQAEADGEGPQMRKGY